LLKWRHSKQNTTTQQMNSVLHYDINAWYHYKKFDFVARNVGELRGEHIIIYSIIYGQSKPARTLKWPIESLVLQDHEFLYQSIILSLKQSDVEEVGGQHNFLARQRLLEEATLHQLYHMKHNAWEKFFAIVIQSYFSIIILTSMSVILNVASRDAWSHLMRPILHAVRRCGHVRRLYR
jgi:hypothetical protein